MSAADEIRAAYRPLRKALAPELVPAFDNLLRVIVAHLPDEEEGDNPFADRTVYGETRSQCSECDGPIMREYDGNSSCDLCILKAKVKRIDDETEELDSKLDSVSCDVDLAKSEIESVRTYASAIADDAQSHALGIQSRCLSRAEEMREELEEAYGGLYSCSHSDSEDLRVRNRLAALEKQIAILAAELEEKEPTR